MIIHNFSIIFIAMILIIFFFILSICICTLMMMLSWLRWIHYNWINRLFSLWWLLCHNWRWLFYWIWLFSYNVIWRWALWWVESEQTWNLWWVTCIIINSTSILLETVTKIIKVRIIVWLLETSLRIATQNLVQILCTLLISITSRKFLPAVLI